MLEDLFKLTFSSWYQPQWLVPTMVGTNLSLVPALGFRSCQSDAVCSNDNMFLKWLGPLLIISDINNFENV